MVGSIFLTGANGGLGSAIAHNVARDADLSVNHGIYAVRDTAQAATLSAALTGASHESEIVSLDLANLDSVRAVAESINERVAAGKIPRIRALILNAGFQDFGKQTTTGDGLDTVFASNYLGHWLLTLLLLQSMDKKEGRIVIIGSQAHDPMDPRNESTGAFVDAGHKTIITDAARFHAIAQGEWNRSENSASTMERFKTGFRRYGASRLFLVMMQHELQSRLEAKPELSGICVLGVDPGTMSTGLQRSAPWIIRVFMFKAVYPLLLWINPETSAVRSTSRSAADVLAAAFGESGDTSLKDAYFNGRSRHQTSQESQDGVKRALVWEETARLAKLKEGDTILGF